MSDDEILGAVILSRNGDRTECYQDPITQEMGSAASTPFGEVQAYQLGQYLRNLYLDANSSSFICGIHSDLVDNQEIKVRVKAGGEGTVVFDSAIALLQGLYPPNPSNMVTLANDTTVVAPLNGYQYIPVETVEPNHDHSLEPWTDCPAFQLHVAQVQASSAFKNVAQQAQPFFNALKDFAFGHELSLENIYNIYDFVSSELVHNQTYAHRLPPTLLEQARGFADFRENAIYSDSGISGIGNIASRTAFSSILQALERIASNDDPLKFMLIETTYQPFISLFHQTDAVKSQPELQAIPDFASAIAIELRRGSPPDARDFLRFKFRNGTNGDFRTLQVFGHSDDISLTEFISRLGTSVIDNDLEWAQACAAPPLIAAREISSDAATVASTVTGGTAVGVLLALVMLLLAFVVVKVVRRKRAVCLAGSWESLSADSLASGVQRRY